MFPFAINNAALCKCSDGTNCNFPPITSSPCGFPVPVTCPTIVVLARIAPLNKLILTASTTANYPHTPRRPLHSQHRQPAYSHTRPSPDKATDYSVDTRSRSTKSSTPGLCC